MTIEDPLSYEETSDNKHAVIKVTSVLQIHQSTKTLQFVSSLAGQTARV